MASTKQTIQRLRENDVQAFNELYQENWFMQRIGAGDINRNCLLIIH